MPLTQRPLRMQGCQEVLAHHAGVCRACLWGEPAASCSSFLQSPQQSAHVASRCCLQMFVSLCRAEDCLCAVQVVINLNYVIPNIYILAVPCSWQSPIISTLLCPFSCWIAT